MPVRERPLELLPREHAALLVRALRRQFVHYMRVFPRLERAFLLKVGELPPRYLVLMSRDPSHPERAIAHRKHSARAVANAASVLQNLYLIAWRD